MKKLFVFAAAAICAAALAVSCQNTEVSIQKPHDYRTVTIQLPEPETKLAISTADGKVAWEAGDVINIQGLYIEQMKTYELQASDISSDGRSAVITFDAAAITPCGADNYYAQYPAEAVKIFRSSTESSYYSQFDKTNRPLMAAYLSNGSFQFENLCGAISFIVTDAFDSYEFSGNNDEAVGYEKFAVKRTSEETYAKDRINALKKVSGDVVSDGVTSNFIFLPWGTDFTEGFSIKFVKNGEIVKVAKTTSAVNVSRNKLLALGDITGRLEDYVPEAHQNKITNATNLGATETANCYIITAAGSYKIPAVKGNSNTSAGVVAGAKILWETYNTLDAVAAKSVIAAVDYEPDAVFFKTPDTLQPGNALIAAVDENDNIIWSWHIWIPASDIQDIGDYKVSSSYIQDRNLGAIVPTEVPGSGNVDLRSVGLYYQWGRKDPFVGYKWGKESIEPKVSGDAARSMSTVTAAITVEESIAKPTTFVAFKGDWLSGHDASLWGNGGDKTIYDPCPAGYRVPDYNAGDPLWQQVVNLDDFSISANDSGHWWKLGSAVFPMSGCYDYDGGISHPFDRTWLWNNKANSNADYGEAQYIYWEEAWKSQPGWGKRKACGCAVRCVKIGATVPEPDATGATGVTIDGNMSEWAGATAFAGINERIVEWRYGCDASNVYFYYKITASKIKYDEETGDYGWKSYIYIGFDTDNNAETGARVGGGTDMETGGEAKALIFPWRGNHNDSSFAFVNGVDGNGEIQCPVGTAIDGAHATAAGYIDGDYAYLEVSIPRENIGSPAAGKIAVAHAMDYYPAPKKEITLN